METPAFYNTTGLGIVELNERIRKAKKQDERVMLILRLKERPMTAFEVWNLYQKHCGNAPITSIRRSLSTLSNTGKVIKCEEKGMGQYGMLTHKWRAAS